MVEENIEAVGRPLFGKPSVDETKLENPEIEKLDTNLEKRVEKDVTNSPMESLIDLLSKQSTPTDFKESKVHGLLTGDPALSNYPDQSTVDVQVEYQDAAAEFALIGQEDIARYIIYKVQNRSWTQQGKDGFLRRTQNESRAVITKTENKTETQGSSNPKGIFSVMR